MSSNAHQRTLGFQPAVRSACEPCHERKSRCISSTDGGPCDNCESRKLSCFFLPRARSGRRPIMHHPSETPTTSPSTNQSSSDSRHLQPQPPNSGSLNDHFDWDWTLPAKGLDQRPQSTGVLDPDRPVPSSRTTNSFDLQPSVASRHFSDLSKTDYQNVRLNNQSAFLATALPDTTRPTPPNPFYNHHSKKGTKLGETEFCTFLQLCTKLQGHVVLAKQVAFNPVVASDSSTTTSSSSTTPMISVAQLQEMLGDIHRSCDVIFSVYGQGILSKPTPQLIEDLDHASVSLAIALIFKIFQTCDTLLSYHQLKNQGLNDLLLHKRLDFNLMQARIVVSKIEELTQGCFALSRNVALTASYVEDKFRAIS